jgi:hypothetical protein
MLRRAIPACAILSVVSLVALTACGSSEPPGTSGSGGDDPTPTDESDLGGAKPFVLVPRAPEVAKACAAELSKTFCTEAAAKKAGASCTKRVGAAACPDGACTLTYAAERASCAAGPTYATRAACAKPQPDDCSFYRACLDAAHPCGEDGYALAYGERLCYAFIENRGSFSAEGQQWLRGVRSCLVREAATIASQTAATCTSVLEDAYATHPGCYTAKGNSICSIPAGDVVELMGIIGSDLFTSRALAQMSQVAGTCVLDFFGLASSDSEWQRHQRAFFQELEAATGSAPQMRAFLARHARASEAR